MRQLFPDKPYVNLERLDEREFALADPLRFLKQFPQGVILDEVQRTPELLSYIQAIVDEEKTKAKFILTGSQNFALIDSISQSLAGRTAIVHLLPFSLDEIVSHYKISTSLSLENLLYQGFYPRIYDEKAKAKIILSDYLQTYLEKDLRDWSRIQDLSLFRKFLKMCAARIGQVLNTKNIADDLGLSHVTIKKWINLLELSFIVYLLPAFSAIEIKSSDRIKDEYFNALEYFEKLFPEQVSGRKYIVYSGDKTQNRSRAHIANYSEIIKSFK